MKRKPQIIFEIFYITPFNKLFIFKNFVKRVYRKKYLFDYLFFFKYLITAIISINLLILNLFNDYSKYSFKIGIFKQSYFSLFIRFKKRYANWYSLLYAKTYVFI